MKSILLTLFLGVMLLNIQSCNRPVKEEREEVNMNETTSDYKLLKKKVRAEGDTSAYYELSYDLIETADSEDSLMYYSRIMAEKYNYKPAYWHYEYAFKRKLEIDIAHDKYNKSDVAKMNKKEKKMILEWYILMYKRDIITKNELDSCLLGQ
ncbi:MAG: hypothetical protein RLZZ306_1814 [Bacteroidota bacterium]|jgi:histidinol phosphatase-like PHP family hydrolase